MSRKKLLTSVAVGAGVWWICNMRTPGAPGSGLFGPPAPGSPFLPTPSAGGRNLAIGAAAGAGFFFLT